MSERNSTSPRNSGRALWTSGTAVTAIFVALAAALGFLLLSVPNVELLTFTVFASGVVLGRWRGALVGVLAMAIYSGANPYGSGLGVPTMLAGQLAASAFAGLMGGITAPLWRRSAAEGVPGSGERLDVPAAGRAGGGRRAMPLVAGGVGFVLTAVYQAAVIVGLAVMSPEFRTGALAVLLSNALFSSVHLVSNTIVFAVLAPAVLPRIVRLAGLRPSDAGARTPSAPGAYGGNE